MHHFFIIHILHELFEDPLIFDVPRVYGPGMLAVCKLLVDREHVLPPGSRYNLCPIILQSTLNILEIESTEAFK